MTFRAKKKPPKAKKPKLTRPHMPDSVKLEAALLQGIACSCCGELAFKGQGEWHHDPALELRAYNPATKKYTPEANDPKFIRYLLKDHHAKQTHGPGGEKRITTKGSDNHTAKQLDKLRDANREHAKTMSTKGVGSKGHSKWLEEMAKAGKPVVPRRLK